MKRFLCLCLSALLALTLAAPALAEYSPYWEVREIASGTVDDFDGDESTESVEFTCETDEYGDGGFTLTVNGQTLSEEYCAGLDPWLRAMKIGSRDYTYATVFMVSEYGPSDDHYTYNFLYMNGELKKIEGIPAHANDFEVSDTGVITTMIRTDMLGTWFRPADYVFASGYDWESEGGESYAGFVESPRDLYPMRMIVTLDKDLSVRASRFEEVPGSVVEGGQKVALTATDDVAWVYVSSLDGEQKGWMHVRAQDYLHEIEVDGQWLPESDVFSNLLYAD